MTEEMIINIKKLKTKYVVETNLDKYDFSEETIIKYALFKGNKIPSELKEEILKEEEYNKLVNKTINFLSYQARSEAEVRSYLKEKNGEEELINKIITKIKNLGYLNDEAYALSVLDYIKRTFKGPNLLKQKLLEKGLNAELIYAVIEKYQENDEEEIIDKCLEKLKERYKKYPLNKQKALLYQKLIRDGFNSELVSRKINHLNLIDESIESLDSEILKFKRKYPILDYQTKNKLIKKLLAKGYDYSKISEALKLLE